MYSVHEAMGSLISDVFMEKHYSDAAPAERSGGTRADQSGTRSEPRLMVEEGLEVEHPGRRVLRWGWSRESRQIRTPVALRCGT